MFFHVLGAQRRVFSVTLLLCFTVDENIDKDNTDSLFFLLISGVALAYFLPFRSLCRQGLFLHGETVCLVFGEGAFVPVFPSGLLV